MTSTPALSNARLTAEPLVEAEAAEAARSTAPLQPKPQLENHATLEAYGDDSRIESELREQFSGLDAHDSIEVSASAGVTAEYAADFKGKLKVERNEDRTFTVEVEAEGAMGVGAPQAGNGKLGIAAGTTFHLKTASETADLCDALIKTAVVTSHPVTNFGATALELAGVKGDVIDSRQRVIGHLSKVSELKLDATAKAEVGGGLKWKGFPVDDFKAKLGASVGSKTGVTVNFEKGELKLNLNVTGTAEGVGKFVGYGFSAEGKGAITASEVYALDRYTLGALRAGTMTAMEAVATLHPKEIVLTTEVEVSTKASVVGSVDGKVKLKSESHVPLDRDVTLKDVMVGMTGGQWSVETQGGFGAALGYDIGVSKAEVAISRRHTFKSEPLTLPEAVKRFTAASDDERALSTHPRSTN